MSGRNGGADRVRAEVRALEAHATLARFSEARTRFFSAIEQTIAEGEAAYAAADEVRHLAQELRAAGLLTRGDSNLVKRDREVLQKALHVLAEFVGGTLEAMIRQAEVSEALERMSGRGING